MFTVNLTEKDVQIIGVALGAMPYRDVVATITSLQQQINAKQAEAVELPEPTEK